jgi:Ca2+-transporting ATPase
MRIILEILREPMFALLLGAAVIYLLLGDLKEAVVLGLFACTSVFMPSFRNPAPSACSKACAI